MISFMRLPKIRKALDLRFGDEVLIQGGRVSVTFVRPLVGSPFFVHLLGYRLRDGARVRVLTAARRRLVVVREETCVPLHRLRNRIVPVFPGGGLHGVRGDGRVQLVSRIWSGGRAAQGEAELRLGQARAAALPEALQGAQDAPGTGIQARTRPEAAHALQGQTGLPYVRSQAALGDWQAAQAGREPRAVGGQHGAVAAGGVVLDLHPTAPVPGESALGAHWSAAGLDAGPGRDSDMINTIIGGLRTLVP